MGFVFLLGHIHQVLPRLARAILSGRFYTCLPADDRRGDRLSFTHPRPAIPAGLKPYYTRFSGYSYLMELVSAKTLSRATAITGVSLYQDKTSRSQPDHRRMDR